MLKVNIERIGDVAVIHCEGRVVQSAAAVRLRDAVTQQKDARVILLDLSDVQSLESAGLGMLVFLQRWAAAMAYNSRFLIHLRFCGKD